MLLKKTLPLRFNKYIYRDSDSGISTSTFYQWIEEIQENKKPLTVYVKQKPALEASTATIHLQILFMLTHRLNLSESNGPSAYYIHRSWAEKLQRSSLKNLIDLIPR
jgi:hypothetical protein